MRLTDDIMRDADNCAVETMGMALTLAASGRFGLIPSTRPFLLEFNITRNVVDVTLLHCLAITRGGHLIDVNYDTRYTNNFDTRVIIPEDTDEKEYILTINATNEPWRETHDGFAEPVYSFSLIAPNTIVPENSMPIGHIVDDYGWRKDDVDFVPPCLFVAAHYKFMELLQRFADVLATIDKKARGGIASGAASAIGIFWPHVQQLRIAADKERDLMTPMMLLSGVQKCVSVFTCACQLDPAIQLADEKMYSEFVMAPYTYKDAYQRINAGLGICVSISQKIDKLAEEVKKDEEPIRQSTNSLAAPVIRNEQLKQDCTSSSVSVQVFNPVPNATVFFSIDGSEPSRKLGPSGRITIDNKFNKKKVPEPDQSVTIRLKSVLGGNSSNINDFVITLHKNYKEWNGYEI